MLTFSDLDIDNALSALSPGVSGGLCMLGTYTDTCTDRWDGAAAEWGFRDTARDVATDPTAPVTMPTVVPVRARKATLRGW